MYHGYHRLSAASKNHANRESSLGWEFPLWERIALGNTVGSFGLSSDVEF